MDQERLAELQKELAKQVFIPAENTGYSPRSGDTIFSLDIQYVEDKAYVAVDVSSWNSETFKTYVGVTSVECEYVPQYFCFREGPPLLRVIQEVQKQFSFDPQLFIIDGHGLAHPRRFGVACWIGVHTKKPTIGCAKETLVHYDGELGSKRGDFLWIRDESEILGAVLRTQNEVKPVFVSPGHQISFTASNTVMLELSPRYRISEPIRRADQAARAYAKGETQTGAIYLGEIL